MGDSRRPGQWTDLTASRRWRLRVGSVGILCLLALIAFGVIRAVRDISGPAQPLTPVQGGQPRLFDEELRLTLRDHISSIARGTFGASATECLAVRHWTSVLVVDQSGRPVDGFRWGPPVSSGSGPMQPLVRVADVRGSPALVLGCRQFAGVGGCRLNGRPLFSYGMGGYGLCSLETGDVDNDGDDEIVLTDDMGRVICIEPDGRAVWSLWTGPPGGPGGLAATILTSASPPGARVVVDASPAMLLDRHGARVGTWRDERRRYALIPGDVDGDGDTEFLVATRVRDSDVRGPRWNIALIGEGSDGAHEWAKEVGAGDPCLMRERMACADIDLDGAREWIVGAPDGTIRLYAADGRELGRQAMGAYISAIAVGAPLNDEPPRLWVAMGDELVALRWRAGPSSP